MKVLHIVGRKGHGKTTLVVDLVRELTRRGVHVGTIKHCGHEHELDTPGTDSFRHRQAGAGTVAAVTPSLTAVFMQCDGKQDAYAPIRFSFEGCGLVLIEGDRNGPGPKIEVWREEVGSPLLAPEVEGIIAIVTDDPVELALPLCPRNDVAALAGRVLQQAQEI